MEKENTSARSLEDTLLASFWQTYYLVATEPLNVWRNGTVVVLDMRNAGFRNIGIHLRSASFNYSLIVIKI